MGQCQRISNLARSMESLAAEVARTDREIADVSMRLTVAVGDRLKQAEELTTIKQELVRITEGS